MNSEKGDTTSDNNTPITIICIDKNVNSEKGDTTSESNTLSTTRNLNDIINSVKGDTTSESNTPLTTVNNSEKWKKTGINVYSLVGKKSLDGAAKSKENLTQIHKDSKSLGNGKMNKIYKNSNCQKNKHIPSYTSPTISSYDWQRPEYMSCFSGDQLASNIPDQLCHGYVVTFVSSFVGIHLQSPTQQKNHEILKLNMNKFWFLTKPAKAASEVSKDENMIYCVYHDGDVFRGRIIKDFEQAAGSYKRFMCCDIDSGRIFNSRSDYIYDLPEELRKGEPLCTFRYLKNMQIPSDYKQNKELKRKIHDYVFDALGGKILTVENPFNFHINIYYKNDLLNLKLYKGIQSILVEPTSPFERHHEGHSPLIENNQDHYSEIQPSTLCDIPATPYRSMDKFRKSICTSVESSHVEKNNNSKYRVKNNLMTMANLISENFLKRENISKIIDVDSPLSKSSAYILKHSTFPSEIDDLLSKGDELLNERRTSYKPYDGAKIENHISTFYSKRHQCNVLEAESDLKDLLGNLSLVCTKKEISAANEERSKRKFNELDQSLHTFIGEFDIWKSRYTECQSKTNALLNIFVNEQQQFLNWTKNIIERKTDLFQQFSFDSTQKLYEQLIYEEKLATEGSMTNVAVLMLIEEIEGRLRKISYLGHISAGIDKRFQNCSYQKNKQFSNESSLSLLSFIRAPKVLAPETKCFFICDIYNELVNYHKKGIVYKMLNPVNIFVKNQGEAMLRVPSQADNCQPFPPWEFTAQECYEQDCEITTAADCYSLGQFILWMACINTKNKFEMEIRRIKKSCPIFERMAEDTPQLRPSLLEIEDSFSTIFPKAFGVTYNENYQRMTQTPETYKSKVYTKKVKIIKRDKRLVQDNTSIDKINLLLPSVSQSKQLMLPSTSTESQNYTSNGKRNRDMEYELSLLAELQDSDSEDLECNMASMMT